MNSKLIIGFLSIFGLAGLVLAQGGHWQMNGVKEAMPDDARAQLMEAVHTCDYEAAKALGEEYGIGKRGMAFQDEELFNKGCEVRQAIQQGDYEKAVQLRNEMREGMGEKMSEFRAQNPDAGMGFRKGMRGNMTGFQGGCPC